MIPQDDDTLDIDRQKLSILLMELQRADIMMYDTILDGFRDLLLSENLLYLLKEASKNEFEDQQIRNLYSKISNKAMYLTAELGQ